MQLETKQVLWVVGWLTVIVIGLVVPAILGILIGVTPNTLVQRADAGQFVSATASAGGFFTPGLSTLQTTRGSFTIVGNLSANRGQPLQVIDRTKTGVQLCVVTTPRVCADLAGQWAGSMQPVPHVHHRFAPLVTQLGSSGVAIWIVWGVVATLLSGIAAAMATAPDARDDDAPTKASK